MSAAQVYRPVAQTESDNDSLADDTETRLLDPSSSSLSDVSSSRASSATASASPAVAAAAVSAATTALAGAEAAVATVHTPATATATEVGNGSHARSELDDDDDEDERSNRNADKLVFPDDDTNNNDTNKKGTRPPAAVAAAETAQTADVSVLPISDPSGSASAQPPAANNSESGANAVDSDEEHERRAQQSADTAPRDSEPHDVKFLGVVMVPTSREHPPNGGTCARAVQFLVKQRSRTQYRGGVAKDLVLLVSARAGKITCKPRPQQPQQHPPQQPPQGLNIRLLQVTCVADHGPYICFITGSFNEQRQLVCRAFCFETESEWASRYLSEQIVDACRVVFEHERLRRIALFDAARGRADSAESPRRMSTGTQTHERSGTPAAAASAPSHAALADSPSSALSSSAPTPAVAAPAPRRREPNESDRLFLAQQKTMEKCLLANYV